MNYQKQDLAQIPGQNMMDNIEQSQKKVEENKQFLIPKVEKTYDKYFQKITELQAGDIIVRNQCKFCNHPLRAEAEEKWETSKGQHGRGNYSLVIRFLNDHAEKYDGVRFNHQNVSDHLNHHYEQQVKRLRYREYGRQLAEVMNYKISKDERFEALTQANELKLFEIAADPDIDLAKQADMMTKLTKSILDIALTQAKLRGDIDAIDVYKEKFQNIIVNYIAKEPDSMRQRELIEQLDIAKINLKEND